MRQLPHKKNPEVGVHFACQRMPQYDATIYGGNAKIRCKRAVTFSKKKCRVNADRILRFSDIAKWASLTKRGRCPKFRALYARVTVCLYFDNHCHKF